MQRIFALEKEKKKHFDNQVTCHTIKLLNDKSKNFIMYNVILKLS